MTYRGKKVRFLDPAEIERAIGEIARMSSAEDVRVALAGGAALQLMGSDRLTKDVDFVASAVPTGVVTERRLTFGGVKGKSPSGVPVDVIVRDDGYRKLYEEALAQADDVQDVPLRVVTPEHAAAMKLAARRAKDEQDLATLIRLGVLDLPKARAIILKHLGPYAVDEFNSYVDEAEWRKSRGEE